MPGQAVPHRERRQRRAAGQREVAGREELAFTGGQRFHTSVGAGAEGMPPPAIESGHVGRGDAVDLGEKAADHQVAVQDRERADDIVAATKSVHRQLVPRAAVPHDQVARVRATAEVEPTADHQSVAPDDQGQDRAFDFLPEGLPRPVVPDGKRAAPVDRRLLDTAGDEARLELGERAHLQREVAHRLPGGAVPTADVVDAALLLSRLEGCDDQLAVVDGEEARALSEHRRRFEIERPEARGVRGRRFADLGRDSGERGSGQEPGDHDAEAHGGRNGHRGSGWEVGCSATRTQMAGHTRPDPSRWRSVGAYHTRRRRSTADGRTSPRHRRWKRTAAPRPVAGHPRTRWGSTSGITSDNSTKPRYSPSSYQGDW